MRKKLLWIFALLFAISPLFSGCGIFYPPEKDVNGYYIKHFRCCGPTAIEKAFAEYNRRARIINKRHISSREISEQIQDAGIPLKRFLSFFDRGVICVTWSWEMEKVVGKYGFKLLDVDKFESLDPSKNIAFILVRGRFVSQDWHWMCYPVDKNIKSYFGSKTKIDKILLLKKIN